MIGNHAILKNLATLGLSVFLGAGALRADDKAAGSLKDEFLTQTLIDKVVLFDLAYKQTADEKKRRVLEAHFAGFIFQIYMILAKSDEVLVRHKPVIKAIRDSKLVETILIENSDDPLNIKMMFDDSGRMEKPDSQRFGIFLEGVEFATWSKYQNDVAAFKQWVAQKDFNPPTPAR